MLIETKYTVKNEIEICSICGSRSDFFSRIRVFFSRVWSGQYQPRSETSGTENDSVGSIQPLIIYVDYDQISLIEIISDNLNALFVNVCKGCKIKKKRTELLQGPNNIFSNQFFNENNKMIKMR